MKKLRDETDPRFKHLLGKRVQVKDVSGQKYTGTLEFAGINGILHDMFHVTVNRCPVWPAVESSLIEYKQI